MTAEMKFGAAQPVRRREDLRFLTGNGRYVDDTAPAGALHAIFLRSPVAHGRIVSLDVTAARAAPGVHLVLTVDDLLADHVDINMVSGELAENRDGTTGASPERPVLARGAVRFVGEAVAMIVAETLAAAKDAADLVDLETEDLPVVMTAGGAPIHGGMSDNVAYDYGLGDAAVVDSALAGSTHRVRLEVIHNRVTAAPMEPRGAWAEWVDGRLHLCVNGQGVWPQKKALAKHLHLSADAVRVTTPDVGGGFGMKGPTYPEYVVIAAAARKLGRPVRWISERGEAIQSDNAGRDLVAVAEIGFDDGLKITGYRVNVVSNLGAYNSDFAQAIQSELFSKVLTGVYDIPKACLASVGIFTNTTPVDAYRGAGRPEAILTIERVMDEAARQLNVDPFDLRSRNFIRSFPYRTATGELIDVGDFDRVLARARTEADVAGFPARETESAARGRLRGLGLAVYVESILGDADETARITLDPDGGATIYVGTQSAGQGHETVFTRMVAERTGIPPEMVRFVEGDSDRIRHGGGTGGSRSVTVQGTATRATLNAIEAGFIDFLAAEWGVEGVTFEDHRFGAPGTNLRLTLVEAAALARTRGRDALLDQSQSIVLDGRSYPNGVHIAEVEIDPATGALTLDRYSVVDDFGTLIAPQLAIGQVHGGVAQGFGQAVTEWVVHDEAGQLLTGSFMDYAMPRADALPMIKFASEPVPSIMNPFGMKGCGEAGTVGALGAISNAVRDALAPAGVARVDMPFTPARIWHWLREAGAVTD